MKAIQVIINMVTAIMLAFALIGGGFAVCVASPVTHGLSWVFSDDATSPFDRNQLATVADATRDYAFGKHDLLALYQTIYDVDVEFRGSVGYSAASTTSAGFPKVDQVTDRTSLTQLREAFNGASEVYCYSQAELSHLDDCYVLARLSYPVIIAAAILALAGLIFTGVTGRRRRLGAVFLAAGVLVMVLFVALAVWAALDFQGFFTAFHGVLFSQGNWEFPYDSLLICALPTAFWVAMGVVWLILALLFALISILIGRKLLKKRQ
jgi:integral membrane protein (TIGR01906 family)